MKDNWKKMIGRLLLGLALLSVLYDVYSHYMQFRFFHYMDEGNTEKIVAHIERMPGLSMNILPYPALCHWLATFTEVDLKNYPLNYAVWHDADIEVIRALLEKGADPDGRVKYWDSAHVEPIYRILEPPHTEKEWDVYEKVLLMAEYGADLHVPGLITKALGKYESDPEQVFRTVVFLWEAGADAKEWDGYNILQGSAFYMETEHLKELFQNEKRSMAYLLNEPDDDGWTPLFYAMQGENYDNCKFLLEQGALAAVKEGRAREIPDSEKRILAVVREEEDGWKRQSDNTNRYHRFTGSVQGKEAVDNVVYLKENADKSSYEVVICRPDTPKAYIVADPANAGTYNFRNPDGIDGCIGHFRSDIFPYYLWGNSEDDNTPLLKRIWGNGK